jgi:hypothetical protein
MSDAADGDVPEGAAVFPLIPEALGVNPLLLGVIHAAVFLSGSSEEVVHPAAADEALDRLADYLQRVQGEALNKVREEMNVLTALARQEKWPRDLIQALMSMLDALGVGEKEDGDQEDGEHEDGEHEEE